MRGKRVCCELCRSARLRLHRVWSSACGEWWLCCTTHSVHSTTALALHGETRVCSTRDSASCIPVEG